MSWSGVAIGTTVVAVAAMAVVALVVILSGLLGPDNDQPSTAPGATDIRWQCTPFGDRIYWRAGYGDTFAVVDGGCRP